MNERRRKQIARFALFLWVLAAAIWLARLDYSKHISLDILDLIPSDERDPGLAMARRLASEEQGRVVMFVLNIPDKGAAGEAFVEALKQSGSFDELVRMGDPEMREAFGEYIFRHRFELILPGWLASHADEYARSDQSISWTTWLAEQAADELDTFLSSAEAMAFEQLFPADPLLLVPAVVERVRGIDQMTADIPDDQVLIWARSAESPLLPEAQLALFESIGKARENLKAVSPGAEVKWTGVARFAAQSRETIKREVTRLNVMSLLAVLAIAALCLRRPHKILHILPVVFLSLMGAWALTTWLVPRVHIIVLVVGALLCGITIDYAFHVYLHPFRAGEDFSHRMRSVLKPLLVGAFTTTVGFSFLLMADLPFIRHLGVFVTAGLLCAVASTILWFSQIDDPHAEARVITETPFRWLRDLAYRGGRRVRSGALIVLAGVAAISLIGPWFVQWYDDIRELEPPAPQLYANDHAIRSTFGDSPDQTTFLTTGDNPAEAREALERFLNWQSKQYPDAQTASLGFVVPTRTNYDRLPHELDRLEGFADAFERTLATRGFETDHFQPFFTEWQRTMSRGDWPTYDLLISKFSAMVGGPLSLLMSTTDGSSWFATVTDLPVESSPPDETATINASQLQTLNNLFGRYRQSALRLSLIGLGVAALGILGVYGPGKGLRVLALPAVSCLFAFGVFGLTGQTLNIFHLLGAFLGVCLSFDYAVFAVESAAKNQPPPISIRLSALTTAASFGVLATSTIPVVAALGTTVVVIVMTALVGVELSPRTG